MSLDSCSRSCLPAFPLYDLSPPNHLIFFYLFIKNKNTLPNIIKQINQNKNRKVLTKPFCSRAEAWGFFVFCVAGRGKLRRLWLRWKRRKLRREDEVAAAVATHRHFALLCLLCHCRHRSKWRSAIALNHSHLLFLSVCLLISWCIINLMEVD